MKHRETTFQRAQPLAGRFFCPAVGPVTLGPLTVGPLTVGPLTLPSPQRGEGEATP